MSITVAENQNRAPVYADAAADLEDKTIVWGGALVKLNTDASDGDLTITNAVASAAAETVDGVEYAAGKAITFDVAAAAGMTPSAPPTTEYEIYFDITTKANGEAHRIKKTVTVETRLEAL